MSDKNEKQYQSMTPEDSRAFTMKVLLGNMTLKIAPFSTEAGLLAANDLKEALEIVLKYDNLRPQLLQGLYDAVNILAKDPMVVRSGICDSVIELLPRLEEKLNVNMVRN